MSLRHRLLRSRYRIAWLAGAAALLAGALSGCTTTPAKTVAGTAAINVVAAENFWGSLAARLGGDHVKVTSIINNPDADPHDYEPTAADGRVVAGAKLAIINGAGYDAWAGKLVDANPARGRTVLDVGDLVGIKAGGNPHRWYSPPDVRRVIDQITADYTKLDPAHATFFTSQHDTVVNADLKDYFGLIDQIKTTYAGTPIGASESIVTPLAEAAGLRLLTPESFLDAISEGGDPTAADKATIDNQIKTKQIKVYVYNSQNATPDVQAQVNAAKAAGIPVTTVTETLTPAGASFQDWQVAQLTALKQALAQATGK
ncbi:zinc ABC transporter solute-binding protein [Planosporangium thailandense]|uniref:Zinc ABC transporter solute-binding protein n=1 Tax=Planosporangium thailandense TaxID=765197 RepID=A0ABX0XU98_9ACTN|nr:zinc ABC transporter substrate-binding protein [Planosporangium thailandense]NJC69586.1 zinc ABC transporter solute-binding protein [Planosporangium thailandense]